jgi:hypothetical protein
VEEDVIVVGRQVNGGSLKRNRKDGVKTKVVERGKARRESAV